MADYLLTNTFNADKIESERQMLLEQGVEEAELDDYLMVMDQVNPQTMLNALDWLKENYGSAEGYITEELGISEKQLETLRDMYLDEEAEYEAAA